MSHYKYNCKSIKSANRNEEDLSEALSHLYPYKLQLTLSSSASFVKNTASIRTTYYYSSITYYYSSITEIIRCMLF